MTMAPKQYAGPDRRAPAELTEEQIECIAEKAAEKAIEKLTGDVYKAVGKSVIQKFIWLVGAVTIGGYLYLKKSGFI